MYKMNTLWHHDSRLQHTGQQEYIFVNKEDILLFQYS
jgi:hypothetical protein